MNWDEPRNFREMLGGPRYFDADQVGWIFKRDVKLPDILEVTFRRDYVFQPMETIYTASTAPVLRTVADVVVRTFETAYNWGLDGRTYMNKFPWERRATIHPDCVPSSLLSQIIYVPVDTEMTTAHRALRNWLMECFKDDEIREKAIRNYQEAGDNESVMTILRFVEENKLAKAHDQYRL